MKKMDLQGRWVLVTGASSGLGREMARVLAREHRANLVLAARRIELLDALASELRSHQVEVRPIAVDLSREEEAERLFEAATSVDLHAAVLNAGITHFGHHDELSWSRFKEMLSLNIVTTTRLTSLLLPYLERRAEHGAVMLVSSMAGLAPTPYQSAYSATKAFLVNYGCSLHHEMAPRGVSITTFAPGGIITEMTQGERFNALKGWLMPVDVCARAAVKAMVRREYLTVPGLVYRLGSVLTRLLPQRFFAGRLAAQYRKSLLASGVTAPAAAPRSIRP
jgi:uncharacterized protein